MFCILYAKREDDYSIVLQNEISEFLPGFPPGHFLLAIWLSTADSTCRFATLVFRDVREAVIHPPQMEGGSLT